MPKSFSSQLIYDVSSSFATQCHHSTRITFGQNSNHWQEKVEYFLKERRCVCLGGGWPKELEAQDLCARVQNCVKICQNSHRSTGAFGWIENTWSKDGVKTQMKKLCCQYFTIPNFSALQSKALFTFEFILTTTSTFKTRISFSSTQLLGFKINIDTSYTLNIDSI